MPPAPSNRGGVCETDQSRHRLLLAPILGLTGTGSVSCGQTKPSRRRPGCSRETRARRFSLAPRPLGLDHRPRQAGRAWTEAWPPKATASWLPESAGRVTGCACSAVLALESWRACHRKAGGGHRGHHSVGLLAGRWAPPSQKPRASPCSWVCGVCLEIWECSRWARDHS